MSQWRRARPEAIIAAIVAVVAALAGLAVAGWPGLALVATVVAVATLLVVRGLAPRPAPEATRKAAESDSSTMRSLTGYSQRRFLVATGITSRPFYEANLRPVLEHLLAARLAERHGVNLYTDPAGARRAFVRTARDDALWPWIDPAAAAVASDAHSGIPRRTLARLIDRLEHL
ncbi:MAG: hypothetical protein JWM19_5982 [Actinomycetia bacterium]|nr:hypothetical protein [Actinomycetes bacterium]